MYDSASGLEVTPAVISRLQVSVYEAATGLKLGSAAQGSLVIGAKTNTQVTLAVTRLGTQLPPPQQQRIASQFLSHKVRVPLQCMESRITYYRHYDARYTHYAHYAHYAHFTHHTHYRYTRYTHTIHAMVALLLGLIGLLLLTCVPTTHLPRTLHALTMC